MVPKWCQSYCLSIHITLRVPQKTFFLGITVIKTPAVTLASLLLLFSFSEEMLVLFLAGPSQEPYLFHFDLFDCSEFAVLHLYLRSCGNNYDIEAWRMLLILCSSLSLMVRPLFIIFFLFPMLLFKWWYTIIIMCICIQWKPKH